MCLSLSITWFGHWWLLYPYHQPVINPILQEYHNDGPLILWTICNNIHRNNIAFVKLIKQRIRESILTHFSNDVSKYIINIKDNLCLITTTDGSSSEHNDLIIYIFRQFIKYLKTKLPNLTQTTLLKLIGDKMQILKHADQWKQVGNPEIMTLK